MRALPLAIVWLMVQSAFGQCNASRLAGTLVIASGGREAVERFVQLAGGPGASIVFIPTAASSLKSDSGVIWNPDRSEEHTSELQSHSDLVCRLLLEKKKKKK